MELNKTDAFSSFTMPEVQTAQTTAAPAVQQVKKAAPKKALMGAAAAAGVAAIAVGGILLHKSHAAKKIIEESKLLQEQGGEIIKNAGEIMEAAQKQFDEVTNLIAEGAKNLFADIKDGDRVVRSFITETVEGELVPTIMKEFDEAGELVRSTGIRDFVPERIEEFVKGTNKSNFAFFDKGILSKVIKGYEELPDGIEKVALDFDFGNPFFPKIAKGREILSDGTEKINELFLFDNDVLTDVHKGLEILPDGKSKINKIFEYYDDGSLAEVTLKSKWNNGEMLKGKIYKINEDGKLVKLKLDDEIDAFIDDYANWDDEDVFTG